jgi:hypothetical protein
MLLVKIQDQIKRLAARAIELDEAFRDIEQFASFACHDGIGRRNVSASDVSNRIRHTLKQQGCWRTLGTMLGASPWLLPWLRNGLVER